ncbi:Rho GTPase activation protein [Cladochytrium replicatum]|nr:Rho GTPase activation protein [Cladochytrium replicatum]
MNRDSQPTSKATNPQMFSMHQSQQGEQYAENLNARYLVDEKLIKQAGVDFESRPMLVFYACHLPNPKNTDYDKLLSLLVQRLDQYVENDYVIVFFCAGSKYQPSWSWLFGAYNTLGRKYRKNLKNLYIVHPAMWLRFLLGAMGAIISPKFNRKIVWVNSLSRLEALVPLSQIQIPNIIHDINLKYENPPPSISRSVPKQRRPGVFGAPLEEVMGMNAEKGLPLVFADCIDYIREKGLDTEGLFRKSPASQVLNDTKEIYDLAYLHPNTNTPPPPLSPKTVNSNGKPSKAGEPRRHLVDFDQLGAGDAHLPCSMMKVFVRELPTPIFPSSILSELTKLPHIPSHDERIVHLRQSILPLLPAPNRVLITHLFELLADVAAHSGVNKMTPQNLMLVWGPNLVRSGDPIRDLDMCATSGPVGAAAFLMITRWKDVFA